MITKQVKNMIEKMREYFINQPILKVWLFGSCSRGEETQNSDVDILVLFVENQRVSLLTMGGMYMDLKKILGREIDLVEEGTLMPQAKESADKDKILIYERSKYINQ